MAAETVADGMELLEPKRGRIRLERVIQVAVVLLVLTVWEIVGRRVGVFILAPPSALFTAFMEMIESGELLNALIDSSVSLVLGYLIAIAIGVTLGFLMGWYRPVALVLDPFVSAFYVVPVAALVPLLIVWLGIGLVPRVVTVILFAVVEITISTSTGVRSVSDRLVEMARSFGADQRQLFSKVVFYGALPILFAGLRIGAGRAIKGMVVAELLFAVTGLGGLVLTNSVFYRTDKVMVTVVVISLLGVLLVWLVQFIERRLAPWWND